MDRKRRQLLGSGVAAGSLFLPLPYAWVWAQSEGALKLLRAPKMALVIGNGKYKDAPELKNPPNDAKGISEALKASGFAVTMKLDTGREEMLAAIRDYVHAMEQKKHVGLFYFAGHGVQLAWRNYLLPVDAVIDKIDDVAKQSIDIARLMEGLTKATNPMNVIILDACRENPFGGLKGADHKGLSQMDAPGQTILAYATSPGNVASDGEGSNGLYTENLLRELKVPEAKIEDIFKRVRLGVRRKTKGAQIPWESTSLEEDFWFLPPKELKQASESEKQARFDEELKIWESAKASRSAAALEGYLRRYPNGEFAELAQLELDTVLAKEGEKRIEVQSQAGNPYSQGYARADTDFKVGDFYSYRILDLETKAQKRTVRGEITSVTDDEVSFGNGTMILDRMGNTRRTGEGFRFSDNQNMPVEFYVGKKWVTKFRSFPPNVPAFIRIMTEIEFRITAREKVEVPAGAFDCFRMEGRGQAISPKGTAEIRSITWYAPEKVRRPIANEITRKPPPGGTVPGTAERIELIAFKQT
jgi:uncharacterized caspase-like protein